MPRNQIIARTGEIYLRPITEPIQIGTATEKASAAKADQPRSKTMNIVFRAAIAAVSFASIGPAYAGDGQGSVASTRFPEVPGVSAPAPAQHSPLFAAPQNGQASRPSGTWLYPPIGKYLDQ
jgi:hypothetical protein